MALHGRDPDGSGQVARATSPRVTHFPSSSIGGFSGKMKRFFNERVALGLITPGRAVAGFITPRGPHSPGSSIGSFWRENEAIFRDRWVSASVQAERLRGTAKRRCEEIEFRPVIHDVND